MLLFPMSDVAETHEEALPLADRVEILRTCYKNTACSEMEQQLSALALCESSYKQNIKVFDSNKKYSYGLFQFQAPTFLAYGQKYGFIGLDIEAAEVENLIYDPETQYLIAEEMWENGEHYHWKICSDKILNNAP